MALSMCLGNCSVAYSESCPLGQCSCEFYLERRYTDNGMNYGHCSCEDVTFPLWKSCDGCIIKCTNGKFHAEEV